MPWSLLLHLAVMSNRIGGTRTGTASSRDAKTRSNSDLAEMKVRPPRVTLWIFSTDCNSIIRWPKRE